MDLSVPPMEKEEKMLRELSSPSLEQVEMQNLDLMLGTTHYETNPRIINLVVKNTFR